MINTDFFQPKYLPTWILILLMKIGVFIPFRVQVFLGRNMGKLFYPLFSRFRKIAIINIQQCFPEKSKDQVAALVKKNFESIGVSFFETANAYYAADKKIQKMLTIENEHHLTGAMKNKGGVIILCSHFMPLMLGSRALSLKHSIANIYRPQNNRLFDKIMVKGLTNGGGTMIKNTDTKAMVKAIKNALPIWYAPDQDLGARGSVFAPLFGIQAATITATSRLAKGNNTAVIPYSFIRTDKGYLMSFSAPLQDYPSGDLVEDAHKTNQILEAQIRKNPEQYLWIHRRFKTRPEGEGEFYPDI
ncbi:MAG: LpxL/LpxP family Kdo(2)-lipid IV(A) lauroyl/palmitoleoyl acyltransferase [Gammaproteobacteria bacterium]